MVEESNSQVPQLRDTNVRFFVEFYGLCFNIMLILLILLRKESKEVIPCWHSELERPIVYVSCTKKAFITALFFIDCATG